MISALSFKRRVSNMHGEFGSGRSIENEIMNLAALVCANEADASRWYVQDEIASLGSLTAEELVGSGAGDQVLAFLMAVVRVELRASRTSGLRTRRSRDAHVGANVNGSSTLRSA